MSDGPKPEGIPPRVRDLEIESRTYRQHLEFIEHRLLSLESDVETNRLETNKKLDRINDNVYRLLWVLIGASFGAITTLIATVLEVI